VPEYEYRDGGLVGDALVEQVVAGAGEHLVPGGTAQFLANWETKDDVAGLDRFRGWVEGSSVPLDAWVIERESLNPIEYAEMWIRDGGTAPGSAEHDRLLNAWLDDFAARGVSEIGFGYVLLRRAAGDPTLARYERVPQPIPSEGALGSHLADALAAHDAQAALGDAELLARRLTTASDVTETRHYLPGARAAASGGRCRRIRPSRASSARATASCRWARSSALWRSSSRWTNSPSPRRCSRPSAPSSTTGS
jgi:hypothetical protein